MSIKEEIEKLANVFKNYNLPKTAKTIEDILKINNLEKAFDTIMNTFRTEFTKRGRYQRDCYEAFYDIFAGALNRNKKRVKSFFDDFIPSMSRLGNAFANIGEIAQSLMNSPNLTLRQRFIGACFNYVLYVEGIFRELCEVIYMLEAIKQNRVISLADLEEKRLPELRDEIRSLNRNLEVMLDGYDNHLRNSIAHANFRFDENTNKMNFKDFYLGRETYNNSLTFTEFADYCIKINEVYELISSFFLFSRVTDILRNKFSD